MDVPRGGQRLGDALLVHGPREVSLREHVAQDAVAARPRGDRMGRGVKPAGGRDHAREQRRLPGLQLFDAQLVARGAAFEMVDVLPKVGLRRGLDPVGAVAEVDRVQISGEDLFLGPLA